MNVTKGGVGNKNVLKATFPLQAPQFNIWYNFQFRGCSFAFVLALYLQNKFPSSGP